MRTSEHIDADRDLKELLNLAHTPEVSPKLNTRVMNSYSEAMVKLHVKSEGANSDLRRIVAVSLVGVFTFSVLLSATVILLLGFEWIKLPSNVVHTLLGTTIAQAVVLYRRVIADLFPRPRTRKPRSRRRPPRVSQA